MTLVIGVAAQQQNGPSIRITKPLINKVFIRNRRSGRHPDRGLVTLITELEDYPPESWHIFLKLLRWQLEEHSREEGWIY